MNDRPWTFDQARDAHRQASRKQEQAEAFVKDAYKDYAEAERAYREALATEITRLRADGMSVTLCSDLARGTKHVAQLKYRRDVAEGLREAAKNAIWRATADRRAVDQFGMWSMRRDLAEGNAPMPDEFGSVIGGRR